MGNSTKRKAFTLIELLIVIAIISLLISIMLPSFGKTRQLARRTLCLTQLRSLFQATTVYLVTEEVLPALNNDKDDGAWQYNYLIYDGRDSESNFGPLSEKGYLGGIEQLFCPVQDDPFHSLGTPVNPWPTVQNLDTRASYGRRYHLSGKSFARLNATIAYAADLLHLPGVVKSGHKTGVNAVFGGGSARWVPDPGILTDNELDHPFDPLDNPIMEDIWDAVEGDS